MANVTFTPPPSKVCTKCKQEYPLSRFYKFKLKYRPECIDCRKRLDIDAKIRKGIEIKPPVKHGLKNAHLGAWHSWRSMKSRCYTPGADGYRYYGGRGITVCGQWKDSFPQFLADMGDRPEGMSLERKDVNGDYTPQNTVWADSKEQSNNTRRNRKATINGVTLNVGQWVEKIGVSQSTVRIRIWKGMTPEEALTRDTRKGRLLTINGETMNISAWAKRLGTTRYKIYRDFCLCKNPPCV